MPRGFTLLEVLVAFVIAALALGALYDGSMGGLRATATSARTLEAVARAQSRLAAASQPVILTASETEGDEDGGFHWHLHIAPVQRAAPSGAGLLRPALFVITAIESWTDGEQVRSVQLATERVAAAP